MHVSLSLSYRMRERNGAIVTKTKYANMIWKNIKIIMIWKGKRWLVFTFEIKCKMEIMSVLFMNSFATFSLFDLTCKMSRHPKSFRLRKNSRTPSAAANWLSCHPGWQLWSAWHSLLLPLIFYLTCLLCINMEEPQKEPERGTESECCNWGALQLLLRSPSQGNSFICVASVGVAALQLRCHCCTSLIMRRRMNGHEETATGRDRGNW